MAEYFGNIGAMTRLTEVIATKGENYKKNIAKFTNTIEGIKNGALQGNLAEEFITKYNDKIDTFQKLARAIDDAEDHMNLKTRKFDDLITSTSSGMR